MRRLLAARLVFALLAAGILLHGTRAEAASLSASARNRPPALARAAATAPARKPIAVGTQARVFEEQGAYASALDELKTLRGMQGPDADLELAIALDEARVGLQDSAWARLHSPLLITALADTALPVRRTEYPFQREGEWLNGRFDGWYWYVARARAELALERRDYAEAVTMASRAAAARPLSGKEALLLAVAAGQAGDSQLGEAAAAWAVFLEPWLPEAHYLSGLWAWRNGRRAEARAALGTAATLDPGWREPVLALARLKLPGTQADSLPRRFLTGPRACVMLTSPRRPKLEEYVQFDKLPVLAFNPQPQPPDSLRVRLRLSRPTPFYVQVLLSETGHPLLAELPWLTEAWMPAGVVNHVLNAVGTWRFAPASKFDKPQRAWASVEYLLQP